MTKRHARGSIAFAALLAASLAHAAVPPDPIHYQGVLRNAAGAPLDGSYDMIFRFFDAAAGGTEILVNRHRASGTGAVTVTGGLFDVALGTGELLDGTGAGSYTSLEAMFRDYASVFVQLEVNAEVLSPRVAVRAAPYAHNTTNLAGGAGKTLKWNPGSQAFEFSGDVEIVGEVVLGAGLNRIRGASSGDDLWLFAGNSETQGGLIVNGSSDFSLYSGDGTFWFRNGAATNEVIASISPGGDLQIDGDLTVSGSQVRFPGGAQVSETAGLLEVIGGDSPTDVLRLSTSLSPTGHIEINGGGLMDFFSGNGQFHFRNGSGTTRAFLDTSGHLQIDGNLTAEGGFLIGPPQNFLRVQSDSNLRFMSDADNSTTTNPFEWFHDGAYTNALKVGELQESGNLRIRGTLSQNVAFDLAESFLAGEPLLPGDLVRVAPSRPDAVLRTTGASDRGVLGIVSERPGVLLGSAPFDPESLRSVWGEPVYEEFAASREALDAKVLARHPELLGKIGEADFEERMTGLALEAFCEERLVPVALAGRVPVRAVGPIEVGDPLGPSALPGVAARATGSGPVVGIALEPLEVGEGRVLAFVSRGYSIGAGVEASPAAAPPSPAPSIPSAPSEAVAVPMASVGVLAGSARAETRSAIAFTEAFPVLEPVGPGDVVAASSVTEGSLALAREPHDPSVVGVVAPATVAGDPTRAAVVMSGTVLVKADAGYGSIRVGDLLTASPTPGHAMRAAEPLPGTILGKALTSLDHGIGLIRLLVMPR